MTARPYAEVIGDPIAHSKSPLIHEFWLEKLGIEGDYRALRVTPVELPAYLEERRTDPAWRGCNVTMPLKETVMAHVDDINPITRRIGAVNTITRYEDMLVGTNTDWIGVNLALGSPRQGDDAVVIGAGGAARAVVAELSMTEPSSITIMNRTPEKAQAILDRFGVRGEVRPIGPVPPADLLINASSLGMAGHPPLDVDLAKMRPDGVVFDMVYTPLETTLLKRAREAGLRTLDGLDMLIGQASMAFLHFFNETVDLAWNPELRGKLTQ